MWCQGLPRLDRETWPGRSDACLLSAVRLSGTAQLTRRSLGGGGGLAGRGVGSSHVCCLSENGDCCLSPPCPVLPRAAVSPVPGLSRSLAPPPPPPPPPLSMLRPPPPPTPGPSPPPARPPPPPRPSPCYSQCPDLSPAAPAPLPARPPPSQPVLLSVSRPVPRGTCPGLCLPTDLAQLWMTFPPWHVPAQAVIRCVLSASSSGFLSGAVQEATSARVYRLCKLPPGHSPRSHVTVSLHRLNRNVKQCINYRPALL